MGGARGVQRSWGLVRGDSVSAQEKIVTGDHSETTASAHLRGGRGGVRQPAAPKRAASALTVAVATTRRAHTASPGAPPSEAASCASA